MHKAISTKVQGKLKLLAYDNWVRCALKVRSDDTDGSFYDLFVIMEEILLWL